MKNEQLLERDNRNEVQGRLGKVEEKSFNRISFVAYALGHLRSVYP